MPIPAEAEITRRLAALASRKLVPATRYITAGTSFLEAKAASLLVISASAGIGILRHRKHGNVDFEKGLLLGVGGVLAALLAVFLAERTPESYLQVAFGLFLTATGVRLWWDVQPRPHTPKTRARRILGYLAVGFLAGLAVGFFGVGGGILMVPALVLLGCTIHVAVGTSLVAVLINAVAATGAHLAFGYWEVMLALGVPLALGSVLGIRFGSDAAVKLHPDRLRRAFAVFLALVGVKMALDGAGIRPLALIGL
ncbi:MAG TPA: sulfite exporter TauE/SafE family protein [Candidatus Thermoplasmatota archaeon]|nr:sulfite exporter TauE/SafE family protein [Candidatus Thermoplasmatota archaeon]